MGWFLEASKIGIVMSLVTGILMGVTVCTSLNDFDKKRKFIHLFPIIGILLFLVILGIKYKEMLATFSMFIFVGFSMLIKHNTPKKVEVRSNDS
jgi:hypothetical protein